MIKKDDIQSLNERKWIWPLVYFQFITIQIWRGTESVLACRIFMTLQFIALKERFSLVTFEPTDDSQSRHLLLNGFRAR